MEENKGSWGSRGARKSYKAGYEYLLAYKISVPIYDYTVIFCKKYRNLLSSNRTFDQMIQASRSGTTNIAEGNQQASLEGYIKLTGVNRASLEQKFVKEGGFRENLFLARQKALRKQSTNSSQR